MNLLNVLAIKKLSSAAKYQRYSALILLTNMLRYLFRKPNFPVICNINNHVFGALSEQEFIEKVAVLEFDINSNFDVIDINAEGWLFSPKIMALSPFTFKKRWMKKELIDLVNHMENKNSRKEYSISKNGNKRLDVIIAQLVEYLEVEYKIN